jgi:hypothetical protein
MRMATHVYIRLTLDPSDGHIRAAEIVGDEALPKVEVFLAQSPASRLAHQRWDKLTTEERRARMAPATAGRVRAAQQKRETEARNASGHLEFPDFGDEDPY